MLISRSVIKKLASVSVFGLGAALFQGETAQAATSNTNLSVTATVGNSCTIGTTSVSFGTYDILLTTPNDAVGAITVQCTTGALYTLYLSQGAHAASGSDDTVPLRQMVGPTATDLLPYGLYTDLGRTTPWKGLTATGTATGGTGNNAVQSYPVYGRIAPRLVVANGGYSDIVQATINY
jgi:spore coat protein U-like protein